jgi:hypothetical protein
MEPTQPTDDLAGALPDAGVSAAFDEPDAGPPPRADAVEAEGEAPLSRKTKVVAVAGSVVMAVATFLGVQAFASHSVATTAAAGTPGGAFGGPGGGGGTVGTLTASDGGTLTVTTPDGTIVKVVTSPSTRVTRVVAGAVSDVTVDDRVSVRGTSSGTNAVAAEQITDMGATGMAQHGGPAAGPGGTAAGSVTALDGGTITLNTDDGTSVRVATSASTTVAVARPISVQDLAVGRTVRVAGATSDGTVTATSVQEGVLARGPDGFGAGAGPQGQGGTRPAVP